MAQWLRTSATLPEGLWFNSEHSCVASQLSLSPLQRDPIPYLSSADTECMGIQTHSYIEKRKKEINVEKEGTYVLHFQWKLLLIFWSYLLTSLKFLIDFPNIALEQSSGQCCFYCEKIKLVKIHTNHTSQKLGDMIQHVSVVNSVVLDINNLSYLQQR